MKTYKKVKGEIVWKPKNSSSSITFSDPKKMGKLTRQFIGYVVNNQIIGKKSTKQGFYKSIGKKCRNGHNSQFFGSIKDSGIVEMKRIGGEYVYTIGENFHHYLNGDLVRYSFTTHKFRMDKLSYGK